MNWQCRTAIHPTLIHHDMCLTLRQKRFREGGQLYIFYAIKESSVFPITAGRILNQAVWTKTGLERKGWGGGSLKFLETTAESEESEFGCWSTWCQDLGSPESPGLSQITQAAFQWSSACVSSEVCWNWEISSKQSSFAKSVFSNKIGVCRKIPDQLFTT